MSAKYGSANVDAGASGAARPRGLVERHARGLSLGLGCLAGALLVTTVALAAKGASLSAELAQQQAGVSSFAAQTQVAGVDAACGWTKFVWIITEVRGNVGPPLCDLENCRCQVQDVRFYDSDGSLIQEEARAADVWAGRASQAKTTQGPAKAFDENPNTYFLDQNFTEHMSTQLYFEFATPVSISSFSFMTGDEWLARDPVTWQFLAINDDGDVLLNEMNSADITEDRQAWTQKFPTAPSAAPGAAGISENISPPADDGWTLVYDEFYSTTLSFTHFSTLCTNYDSVMVAAKHDALENVMLASVESQAFISTLNTCTNPDLAMQNPDNAAGAYWYGCEESSFGFAPTEHVALNPGDTADLLDSMRLSWDSTKGGYRAGALTGLDADSSDMKKQVYCK